MTATVGKPPTPATALRAELAEPAPRRPRRRGPSTGRHGGIGAGRLDDSLLGFLVRPRQPASILPTWAFAPPVPELRQLRAALTYDEQAMGRDLPDLVSFMMATGLRIGETTGLAWDAVDLDLGTVDVRAAAIRVKGQGLIIKSTKTDAGTRTLVLPQWCVAILRRRHSALAIAEEDSTGRPVFPAPLGGWRDPSNTKADLRDAFTNAGFGWVTSHVFRKTVATVMDQAGLSSRAAADQLGHANISMTSDVYFGRKVLVTGAASVLEVIDTP